MVSPADHECRGRLGNRPSQAPLWESCVACRDPLLCPKLPATTPATTTATTTAARGMCSWLAVCRNLGGMEVRPGSRLKSVVCDTQVIVVRAPSEPQQVVLCCGGQPMVALDAEGPAGLALDPEQDGGTLLGKRYVYEDLEVLCTKAGKGSLSVGGVRLPLKEAKPLPASD
jgi:hypothetical protein